jgi:DNA helicase-2/ATP-dependent DNA helicase PcrA
MNDLQTAPSKPFTPSVHQQAFFDWIAKGRGSLLLIAVAGSGKTTSVIQGQRFIPEGKSVQLLAFNTTIAKELKERLAKLGTEIGRPFAGWRAGTFHSLGFGAVCRKLGMKPNQMITEGNKLDKICRGWLGEEQRDVYGSFICRLVGLAKGEGIGALVPDTEDRWYALISHHDLYLEAEEATEAEAVALARQLLVRSNEAAKQGHIDFDDMLYLPILWKLRLWQNDWVLIDEAQDTNPVRRALAKLALKPGGRLVAIGDPRQAIYGFTGASHDAMELIRREFSCAELPLSVSYRCSKAAIRRAQTKVSHIEAHAGAIEGEDLALGFDEAAARLGAHDAILCRQTAPLIGAAYRLIAKGVGCTILGRDIATGLVNLIKKQRAAGIDRLIEKLEAYRSREVAKHTAKGEEQKAEAVSDRVDCISVCIENLPENERTVPKLIAQIEGMFSDTNGVLTLATVHKAKGKEWDNVAILEPELMPSRWARQEHQRLQEENLMYVAWTRTKGDIIDIVTEGK